MSAGPPRIFCIGRNYQAHIAELQNPPPGEPVIFLKPATALVHPGFPLLLPTHGADLHFETEIVVRIGKPGHCRSEVDAPGFIDALTLGFDLTLRDVQDRLKAQGLPWEMAKAFDHSAPVGKFAPFDPNHHDLGHLSFEGLVNQEIRQRGDSSHMLFSVPQILTAISKAWKLLPGDIIYTGTPAGVGRVQAGDTLTAMADWCGKFSWTLTQ